MMRLLIALLLCLSMFVSFTHAELPTQTLAEGGWFAIGRKIESSPGLTIATFCNGLPCTLENFSDAYGSVFVGMTSAPGFLPFYDRRNKAIDGLINDEFGIEGSVCNPFTDTGKAAILISGFARYYTLRDFFFTELAPPQGTLAPGAEPRIMDFTGAFFSALNNQNLGPLSPLSSGPLIDKNTGGDFTSGNYPISFTSLDIQLYQIIASWAGRLGFVVNAFNISSLRTLAFTCP